jgi:rubrerythrin
VTERYKAHDVFRLAERIEENGARYYRKAAEQFLDQSVKGLLLGLATSEDEHQIVFAAMRSTLASSGTENSESQADEILAAMADGIVFDADEDPADALLGNESVEAVLKKSIELEKDSIVFYLGLKTLVQGSKEKLSIDEIIGEEMGHVAILGKHLASLRGRNQ